MQRKVDIKIPDHWVQVRVDQISEIIRGVSYKKEVSSDTLLENHLPILRATNIQEDKLILDSDLVFIPEKIIKPDQLLKVGDIVVCISSGSKNLVGKAAQLNNDWIGSFGTFCATIRFKPQVNKKFGGFFFKSPIYREKIKEKSSGININNIRTGHLGEISFPLPPFPEQERIVSKIEELFTQLDAAEAALKRAKNNLKRYQQSLLQAAVTGELTREWREAHKDELEPASKLLEKIKAERRAKWEAEIRAKGKDPAKEKYQESKSPDVSDLPELPEGWCWVSISQVADHRLGKMLDKDKNQGQLIPYLRNANVQWFNFDLSDLKTIKVKKEELENVSIIKGDLIICEGGEPGRSAVWNYDYQIVIQKALHRVRFHEKILPEYVNYHLANDTQTGLLERHFTGSTIKHFTGESLSKYILALPSFDEQLKILELVENNYSKVQQLIQLCNNTLIKIQNTRKSILKKAFLGFL